MHLFLAGVFTLILSGFLFAVCWMLAWTVTYEVCLLVAAAVVVFSAVVVAWFGSDDAWDFDRP